jgi:hypothetical protein
VFVSVSAELVGVVPETGTMAEAEAAGADLEACRSWARSNYWGGRSEVAIADDPALLQCQSFHHWPNVKPLALVGRLEGPRSQQGCSVLLQRRLALLLLLLLLWATGRGRGRGLAE